MARQADFNGNIQIDGSSNWEMLLASQPRVRVGGLPVVALDRRSTAQLIANIALVRRGRGGRCAFFTATNGNVVSTSAADAKIRSLFSQADAIVADGMPIVFASRLLCPQAIPERVATTDSFHDVAALADQKHLSFFLLGASAEVNTAAIERIRATYPNVRIAGARSGYFKAEDEEQVVHEINAAAPDVLWIGMGVPREQTFIVRWRDKLHGVGVAQTCGGLFDFIAGKNTRAPQWMQDYALEWLYRLWLEPRRLGWRYLVTNPHALWLLATRSGAFDSRAMTRAASHGSA